jgi:hypothetical protein
MKSFEFYLKLPNAKRPSGAFICLRGLPADHREREYNSRIIRVSRFAGIILPFAVSLFFTSCAISPVVESFRDPDLDYSAYKTFSLISSYSNKNNKDKREGDLTLEEKALFKIVRADMEKRGLVYRNSRKESDFAVSVVIVNRYKSEYVPEKTVHASSETYLLHEARDTGADQFFIFPISRPITYGGYTDEYFQIYAELNFYDSKTNKKIWKGSGLYRAQTYDMGVAAPPLISAILNRFRRLPEEEK